MIMTENDVTEIPSPCIGVCAMNGSIGLCEGCFRTIDEIRAWWDMDNDGKAQVMQVIEQRQAALFD